MAKEVSKAWLWCLKGWDEGWDGGWWVGEDGGLEWFEWRSLEARERSQLAMEVKKST